VQSLAHPRKLPSQALSDFASTIAKIIDAALSARPDIPRPLVIQHRAKDEAKLRDKLNQRGILESDAIESLIKDLAGCRLVFYTNLDVDNFIRSHIVFDNFDVQTDETKFHHPVPNGPGADTNYRAVHYIVSLTAERLALPEYARFANMRCEIQLQTLLNHAWAETSHDIIYKNPFPPGFGTRQLDAIKRRMDAIMTEYLVPAGYEFQKIQNDVERLKQGKDLLQRGPFEQLGKAADNNERVELLDHFRDHVVPFYDDITAIYPELRRSLLQAIHAGRATASKPIETAFGELKGKATSDVTGSAVDILDHLRYIDTRATFASYCEIFPGATEEAEKTRILNAVGHLAENNIKVWSQAGPYVQSELVDAISAFDADKRNLLRPIVLSVCEHALSPEVTGTSSPSFDTISFHRGSVRVSDALKRVRSMALDTLETLYQEAQTEEERYAAFNIMLDATRHPYQGQYSDDLLVLILQNTQRIVDFCAQHREQMSYELLQRKHTPMTALCGGLDIALVGDG
jgi:ppGpp synthetase/RelA/SpoT-type nucleotidyltranferase